MITVITSSGKELESKFDLRFGRAANYCVYNEESKAIEFVENENFDAQGGAGTKAAEKMVELKVGKVISGHFGPKAKDLLDKFNIQMVMINDENNSIQDIINKIKS